MADSLATMKSYLDTEFHVHWYYGYWVQGGEEEGEEQHGQCGKFILSYNSGQKW